MALSSDAIDIAIICSTKAREFVKADDRFELIPNAISNTSIIIMNNTENKKIGISAGRQYEEKMVEALLTEEYSLFATNTRVLPYALEKAEVGGIVIDYLSSVNLIGERIFPSNKEFNTYSIIVNKNFKNKIEYKNFVEIYNETVNYLSEDFNMLLKAEEYLGDADYTVERRKREWQMLNLKMQTLEK